MLEHAATHGWYDVLLWELQLGNMSLSEYTVLQASNPKLKTEIYCVMEQK